MNSSHLSSKARRAASGFFSIVARCTLPAAIVTAALPIVVICGCDSKPTAAAGPTHTVRGRVMKLPVAGDPSSSFSLFHEDIPQWLRPDGTRGMNSMIMPFPLAKGVSVDGIVLNDIVEISIQQYTAATLPYEITSIKKLPPDTKLVLPDEGK